MNSVSLSITSSKSSRKGYKRCSAVTSILGNVKNVFFMKQIVKLHAKMTEKFVIGK